VLLVCLGQGRKVITAKKPMVSVISNAHQKISGPASTEVSARKIKIKTRRKALKYCASSYQ
jgi:hypothetical protein